MWGWYSAAICYYDGGTLLSCWRCRAAFWGLVGKILSQESLKYSYVRRMLGHRGRLKVMRRLALRSIVLFWIKIAAESSCAPGGAARKRDLCSFEADFPFRLARDSEE